MASFSNSVFRPLLEKYETGSASPAEQGSLSQPFAYTTRWSHSSDAQSSCGSKCKSIIMCTHKSRSRIALIALEPLQPYATICSFCGVIRCVWYSLSNHWWPVDCGTFPNKYGSRPSCSTWRAPTHRNPPVSQIYPRAVGFMEECLCRYSHTAAKVLLRLVEPLSWTYWEEQTQWLIHGIFVRARRRV